jgi:DNA topoisomerase-1
MSKKTKKKFIACDKYPNCEITYALPQNALIKPTETPCVSCQYPQVLIIRKRARPQTTCINPLCPTKKLDTTEQKEVDQIESGKIEKKCPEKGCEGNLIVRKSFYGMFLGCSSYPKCRHTEKLDKDEKKTETKTVAKTETKTAKATSATKSKTTKPRTKKTK